MTEMEKWYALKCYSMFNRNQQDIFDFFFAMEGYYKGGFEDIARDMDNEYISAETVEKELQGNLFNSFFCIFWKEEDDNGNRLNNSDIEQIFMLDTVWERMVSIGKEIIGDVEIRHNA